MSFTTKKKRHAQHNEEVYNYLQSGKDEFTDWMIITAFYAALHYIESQLFPRTVQINDEHSVDMTSVEQYQGYGEGSSVHQVRLNLIKEDLPEIYTDFKILKDKSETARYHDFQFEDPEEEQRIIEERLESIKKVCN